jgi:2-keto-3-deoxy-L-rhamnonate aldolase RhmA
MATTVLRQNKLRELMKKGKPTVGTHIHSSWPGTIEVIGNSGMVDYVEFTSVYAPFDLYALDNLARASELYDMSTMIKIDPQPNYFLAQRAIGSGIQNILFADLRSLKEVEDATKSVRSEPRGWNGCSMHRIEGYMLECGTKKFEKYAEDVVVGVMMEKKQLYDKMEDVMNMDDVDMIQFGPCDFAMSLGVHGQYTHPKVVEAEEKTIKMALKYDKHPRAEIDSNADTGPAGFQKILKRYVDLGVTDYCIGVDVVILFEWMREYVGITKKALKLK